MHVSSVVVLVGVVCAGSVTAQQLPYLPVVVFNPENFPVPVREVAPATSAPEFAFIGFSAAEIAPDVGLRGLHGACQDTFGPQSRTCLLDEISRTVTLPSFEGLSGSNSAWVNSPATALQGDSWFNATCGGWRLSTDVVGGLVVVAPDVQVNQRSCSFVLPVSCCAPGG